MSLEEYNRFANKVYSHGVQNGDGGKSFVISPLSIQTALGLAYMGAEGSTAEEMKNGLHLTSGDKAEIEKYFETTLSQANAGQVLMANKVYVQKDFAILPGFVEKAVKSFLSEAENIDFDDVKMALEAINGWVAKKTNNKITNFLDESALSKGVSLMLLNTIYVQAFWDVPFNPGSTSKEAFYLTETESLQLDTMHAMRHLGSCDLPALDASAVKLQCKDGDVSMVIVLPNQRMGLKALEAQIESLDVNEIVKGMQPGMVSLGIPKFRIEAVVNMERILKSMGLGTMFSAEAEFPGISAGKLKISSVLHKAVIEVDEFGLVASAATEVMMRRLCARDRRNFKADHPFWFAVRQGETTLFTGRFTGQ